MLCSIFRWTWHFFFFCPFQSGFFSSRASLRGEMRILAVGLQNESQSFFALPHVPHPPTIVIIVRLHTAVWLSCCGCLDDCEPINCKPKTASWPGWTWRKAAGVVGGPSYLAMPGKMGPPLTRRDGKRRPTSCHATVGRRATSLYTRLLKNQIELGVGSTNFQDNQNILQGINTIIVCSKHRHTPYDHCSSKHKTDQQYKILLTPDNIFLLDPCAQSRGHDLVRTLPTYYLTDNANILISISTTTQIIPTGNWPHQISN